VSQEQAALSTLTFCLDHLKKGTWLLHHGDDCSSFCCSCERDSDRYSPLPAASLRNNSASTQDCTASFLRNRKQLLLYPVPYHLNCSNEEPPHRKIAGRAKSFVVLQPLAQSHYSEQQQNHTMKSIRRRRMAFLLLAVTASLPSRRLQCFGADVGADAGAAVAVESHRHDMVDDAIISNPTPVALVSAEQAAVEFSGVAAAPPSTAKSSQSSRFLQRCPKQFCRKKKNWIRCVKRKYRVPACLFVPHLISPRSALTERLSLDFSLLGRTEGGCPHPQRRSSINTCPKFCTPAKEQWQRCVKLRCWPNDAVKLAAMSRCEGTFTTNRRVRARVVDYVLSDWQYPNPLIGDQEFLQRLAIDSKDDFESLPSELQSDRDFVLSFVSKKGEILQYVKKEFQRDEELLVTAAASKFEGALVRCFDCLGGVAADVDFLYDLATKVRSKLEAFDAFKAFLCGIDIVRGGDGGGNGVCLNLLDCGGDTGASLKKSVAEFVGVPVGKELRGLRALRKQLVEVGIL